MEDSLKEEISFVASLDDTTMSVAIIDEYAMVLRASSHFSVFGETVKFPL